MARGLSLNLDDPNTWDQSHEYRIYASNDPDFYVEVDREDYSFLAQSSWSVHTYTTDGNYRRKKLYLRRSISDFWGSDGPPYISQYTGRPARNRKRVQRNLFLHFVVMLRKTADGKGKFDPPDKHHHIVDHKNRDTHNCRRSNLEWSTASKNTFNVNRKRIRVNRKSG